MSALADLVSGESILLDAEAGDWRSAIEIAGSLLESRGIASAAYTQSMIDNVTEHGPYIVVAPGFAFAHARPSEAVHRTGMSWVRLAEPVSFGHESHDPVTLVVALAAEDSKAHTQAMAQLAKVIGTPARRQALDKATSPSEIRAILAGQQPAGDSDGSKPAQPGTGQEETAHEGPAHDEPSRTATHQQTASHQQAASHQPSATDSGADRHLILTVCGNGLGTSLFLKNTLEQVLDTWGWSRYLTVEATDTISARGKANEAKAILTSGEIARTLGDVGIPVRVVQNFTSTDELDAAMRELYDV